MRGRKPKPNHLKVVEGTFRKDRAHPERDVAFARSGSRRRPG